ncbi:hypothetical protein ACFQ0B_06740 [Nonomuraea thailandensis]
MSSTWHTTSASSARKSASSSAPVRPFVLALPVSIRNACVSSPTSSCSLSRNQVSSRSMPR